MQVSANGIAVLHYFESCRLTAYPDPGTGGAPWTIGWGHTGPEVVKGLNWTQLKADEVFAQDLAKFESGVGALLKHGATQAQFDALVCFAYNCGLTALKGSTLLKLFNDGRFDLVPAQFARWNKAGGKEMKGLTRRRAAEVALFRGRSGREAIAIGQAA